MALEAITPRIWFTADEHYDHLNIIRYCGRPFSSLHHMQEEIIRRHNSRVHPEDTVYHLGDFSLSEKTVPLILPQLQGTHVLVAGNHDACHPRRGRRANAAYGRYHEYGFKVVHSTACSYPFPWGVTRLTHMPPLETADQRYPEYRPVPDQCPGFLLHGHVHERWGYRRVERPRCSPLHCINVGVDRWDYYPISVEELAEYIGEVSR